ncbi:MAG: M48 family metallopeptidase [Armatimonadetes bacterium]|nr:M48 family metallopeptidase [Armatimonadota bacterium]
MKRTLREQIAANKRASFVYAFFLVLLLAALGAVLAGYYQPDLWLAGAVGAGVLGLFLAMLARFSGPGIVLAISGAREASPIEDQVLSNVTEEMAIAAGIPKPRVMVIDDSAPNAFATGPDPEHATVCCTTGLLEKLNREELQAVIAHEIGHIRNFDIRFMTTIALVAGLIPLLADFLGRSIWWGGGRRSRSDNNGGNAIFVILGILLAILAPLFAALLHMAVSRQREYLADATAAQLTRNPEGLVSALTKISEDHEPLEAANRATEHLYIVNPIRKLTASLDDALSTHPSTADRIRALRGLAGNYAPSSLEG